MLLKLPVLVPNGPDDMTLINVQTNEGVVGYPKGTQPFCYILPRAVVAIEPKAYGAGCIVKLLGEQSVATTLTADEAAELIGKELARE
jgi:hypothetical protein